MISSWITAVLVMILKKYTCIYMLQFQNQSITTNVYSN